MGWLVKRNLTMIEAKVFLKPRLRARVHSCWGVLIFLCPAFLHYDFAANASAERPAERINRSVLTVGREVYSATDAAALLLVWNLTQPATEKPVFIQTPWLAGFTVADLLTFDPTMMEKIWPEDVRVFFQIALIWVDVQKLNLFIPKEQEISALLSALTERQGTLTAGFEPMLAKEVMGASEKQRRKWIEMVVRARTFLRVRGGLEKNKNLFNVGWYWHRDDVSGLKVK